MEKQKTKTVYELYSGTYQELSTHEPQRMLNEIAGWMQCSRCEIKWFLPTPQAAWNAVNHSPSGVALIGSTTRNLWTLIRREVVI